MKYNIRKTTRNTARIVIEASHSPGSKPPEIQRLLHHQSEHVLHVTGSLLGFDGEQSCALVIEVEPDDLLCIKDVDPNTGRRRQRHFRIGHGFHPLLVAPPDESVTPELLRAGGADQSAHESRDEVLRSLFRQTHPAWLRKILERQLRHWKGNDPDSYYRFAPLTLIERDLKLLPGIAPFAALARFRNRLDERQLARCVGSSPKGAVIYATDEIPQRDREAYLVANAKEALQFAADRLTDIELGICSRIEMMTAYRLREQMTGHRRAIVLACTYQIIVRGRQSLTDTHAELRQSLLAYPDQWLASDPGGFRSIFRGLRHVGVSFEPGFITALQSTVGVFDRQALAGVGANKS